jgi:hypothetical protein
MNSDQVGGVLRAVFAGLAGFVAAKGWIPADTYGAITTSVTTLVVAIWSWKVHA